MQRTPRALIFQALGGEPFAHAVDVDAEFAGLEPAAGLGLLGLAGTAGLEDGHHFDTRHDANPVVVGHDHVTRMDRRTGADDRHVHRTEALLHRALGEYRFRPDGKAHPGQVAHVAHSGLDD
jgi:hypothetical protein